MADIVLKDRVYPEVAGWADELTAIRHEIHQHPEPGLETAETAARIVRILKGWGLTDIDDQLVRNGVVVRIEGNRPGAVIGLRADIDALKMDDQSVNPWKSLKPGLAHTCGHDGHQTWLMGALRYLHLHRDFPGTVIGIFQPAEEIAEGAKAVVASGVFEKYGIQEILGAHDEPALPKGVFGMKSGPLQASSDNFFIKVIGKGTHGGRPHQGLDPIPVGCQIVSDVQTIISRRINPADPAVISICSLNAGKYELTNVVPGVLTMSGTVISCLVKEATVFAGPNIVFSSGVFLKKVLLMSSEDTSSGVSFDIAISSKTTPFSLSISSSGKIEFDIISNRTSAAIS